MVTDVTTGKAELGTSPFSTKAQGQFVIVDVSVSNVGDEARTFSDSSAKAFDSRGRQFSASAMASIYLEDSNSFFTSINPGTRSTAKLSSISRSMRS